MLNIQDTQTKLQSAFQRFKAPIRRSPIYKIIFHTIRSIKNRETMFMSDDEKMVVSKEQRYIVGENLGIWCGVRGKVVIG